MRYIYRNDDGVALHTAESLKKHLLNDAPKKELRFFCNKWIESKASEEELRDACNEWIEDKASKEALRAFCNKWLEGKASKEELRTICVALLERDDPLEIDRMEAAERSLMHLNFFGLRISVYQKRGKEKKNGR